MIDNTGNEPRSFLLGVKSPQAEIENHIGSGYAVNSPLDQLAQDRINALSDHYGRGELFKAVTGQKRRNAELDRHLVNAQETFTDKRIREIIEGMFTNELKLLKLAKEAPMPKKRTNRIKVV